MRYKKCHYFSGLYFNKSNAMVNISAGGSTTEGYQGSGNIMYGGMV
jgi:hypothetical protein